MTREIAWTMGLKSSHANQKATSSKFRLTDHAYREKVSKKTISH